MRRAVRRCGLVVLLVDPGVSREFVLGDLVGLRSGKQAVSARPMRTAKRKARTLNQRAISAAALSLPSEPWMMFRPVCAHAHTAS